MHRVIKQLYTLLLKMLKTLVKDSSANLVTPSQSLTFFSACQLLYSGVMPFPFSAPLQDHWMLLFNYFLLLLLYIALFNLTLPNCCIKNTDTVKKKLKMLLHELLGKLVIKCIHFQNPLKVFRHSEANKVLHATAKPLYAVTKIAEITKINLEPVTCTLVTFWLYNHFPLLK